MNNISNGSERQSSPVSEETEPELGTMMYKGIPWVRLCDHEIAMAAQRQRLHDLRNEHCSQVYRLQAEIERLRNAR